MAHPLESARLKVGRARERFKELNREVQSFLDSQPYLIVPEDQGEGGWYTMRCRVFASPPTHLGLIAGDFAHNLRSALDHMVFALAALGPEGEQGRGEWTQFPLLDKIEDYDRLQDRYLQGVRDVDRAAIRELQPFQRPDSLLAAIGRLDNRDKHRTVDPVVSLAAAIQLDPWDGTAIHEFRRPSASAVYLDDGADLGSFRASSVDANVRVKFAPQLAFAFRTSDMHGPLDTRKFADAVNVVISILADFSKSFD